MAEGPGVRWLGGQSVASQFAAVIPVTIVLDRFVDLVFPEAMLGGRWQAAFAVDVVGGLIALVLFLRYRPAARWPSAVVACLATFLGVWVLAFGLAAWRGDSMSATTLLVPLAVAMPALKRPPVEAVRLGVDAFAWGLVVTSLVALVLEIVGAVPTWYATDVNPDAYIAGDRGEYWMPLADPLGLAGRWAGPFGHPSLAGPVGAFLVVYGLSRFGVRRACFTFAGVAMLLLAASRTSLLVTSLGLLVLFASRRSARIPRVVAWSVGAVLIAVFVVGSAYLVRGNLSLTGRTTMWPEYVTLWRGSPMVGVGAAGIWAAIDAGDVPVWASHAHNLWLDALGRMGLVGFVAIAALLVQSTMITFRAWRCRDGIGLALVSLILLGTLTDTVIDWRFAGPTLMTLLFAILLSGWASSGDSDDSGRVRERPAPDEALSGG